MKLALPLLLGLTTLSAPCGATPQAGVPAATKAVFVHVMTGFRTPAISGFWSGWKVKNQQVDHNPEKLDEKGRRDIGSVYYPIIGPYDQRDPALAEYQCQLVNMIGVDGFCFDLGAFEDRTKPNEAMENYKTQMKRYGLTGILVYEEKAAFRSRKAQSQEEADALALKDLEAWRNSFSDVNYRIGGRPVVTFFRYYSPTRFGGVNVIDSTTLNRWKTNFPETSRPILLATYLRPQDISAFDGIMDWINVPVGPAAVKPGGKYQTCLDYESEVKRFEVNPQRRKELTPGHPAAYYLDCVWPGFNDEGCWAWGDAEGVRYIDRADGKTYAYHWDRVEKDLSPLVQIASWNDWMEGHNIEPSVEFGYKYIEMTRARVAQWKGKPMKAANLRLPEWIYRIRKQSKDAKTLGDMLNASDLIAAGDYGKAESLVLPRVKEFSLDSISYLP
jgi:hypothetical protein